MVSFLNYHKTICKNVILWQYVVNSMLKHLFQTFSVVSKMSLIDWILFITMSVPQKLTNKKWLSSSFSCRKRTNRWWWNRLFFLAIKHVIIVLYWNNEALGKNTEIVKLWGKNAELVLKKWHFIADKTHMRMLAWHFFKKHGGILMLQLGNTKLLNFT